MTEPKRCRYCEERIRRNPGGLGYDVGHFPWLHTTSDDEPTAPYPVCNFTPSATPKGNAS